jgi:hypothetical protein
MGGDYDCASSRRHTQNCAIHQIHSLSIEARIRFIHEEKCGREGEDPTKCQAATHASGEPPDGRARVIPEADSRKDCVQDFGVRGYPPHSKGKCEIFSGGEVFIQCRRMT